MTPIDQTHLLIGSLSNDMFRVATSIQRSAMPTATRFLIEAKKWSSDLENQDVAQHIKKIIHDINISPIEDLSLEAAERYLMYGVLLQNYALHYAKFHPTQS